MPMIVGIVDSGTGNLGSIQNMLKRLGVRPLIACGPEAIGAADKLILPGVGAFEKGMGELTARKLAAALTKKVLLEKTPILGICLGAQLLGLRSEEGTGAGLGWIDAEVVRFRSDSLVRIPHMGWNEIEIKRPNPLLSQSDERLRFYFVHSYHIRCRNDADVIATSHHGIDFNAAVNRENIWGVQFHPEKSHRFGKQVLRNFLEL